MATTLFQPEPRRSNRPKLKRKSEADHFDSDPDDPDSDFIVCAPEIENFDLDSSPDLSKPPPVTSTAKKTKKKIVIRKKMKF
jgi:hypothetical protein